MYVDPSGHFAITSFLISVGISAAISIIMELIEDGKDGQYFNDKDIWDYVGAASMVETLISGEATSTNLMSTFLKGAVGGLIGFGVGEALKYGASFLEAGAGKLMAKFSSNNTVNRIFTKMGASSTKIGTKSIRKIANGLFTAEKNYFAVTISSLGSGWF